MRDSLVKGLSSFHAALFRASGGRFGDRLVDNDMLLLTTTGIVTGKPHTVPLLYLDEGHSFIVIASYGGRPEHPQWYRNLLDDPRVMVRTKSDEFQALARPASASERSLWWDRVITAYEGYRDYQARTEREIPLVFLTPVT